jgi:gamma-F420-2:alpha-L-glutamate ligase
MRIVLLTTSGEMGEHGRIAQEVSNMGYEFKLINLLNFEYAIINGKLEIEGFSVDKGDIVIPRGIFSSLHAICTLVLTLRNDGIKVFDNNLTLHKYSINKLSDFIKLAKGGIPIPDSYHLHSYDKYQVAADKLGYPLIAKLTKTGKGAGIYKIDDGQALADFISSKEEEGIESSRYMLQEYIDYKYDLRVLIFGEKVYCMRRIPGVGEFRANFSLGGSVEVFELEKEDEELARKAMKAVDLEIAGVDLLITNDDKRYILEVNHTPGMLGMEKATDENITKDYLEYAINHAK